MEQQRLKALTHGERMDFWGNENPKCPHCGHVASVSENEWWRIYEEGEHVVECPDCGLDYAISTCVSYSFNTDNQDDDE